MCTDNNKSQVLPYKIPINRSSTKTNTEILEKIVEQSGAKPQLQLGRLYKNGEGVSKDYQRAFYWFKKAASKGLADALYEVGEMYYQGIGVSQNHRKAFYYFEKAAYQKHSKAQFRLDRKAAYEGDVDAQYRLGDRYNYGKETIKDYQKSYYWFKKAANRGNVKAQLKLGQMYQNGNGVLQNNQKALYWFEKAVSQEHWLAQYNISKIDDGYISKILGSLGKPVTPPQTSTTGKSYTLCNVYYRTSRKSIAPPQIPTIGRSHTSDFLESLEQFLLSQNERDRCIFINRLGFKTSPQTLQAIGDSCGITRERVRQIEKKLIRKLRESLFWNTFEKKIRYEQLLGRRDSPLSIANVEVIDPWFKDMSKHTIFYSNLVDAINESDIHILEIDNIPYFGTIGQSAWDKTVKEAKTLLSSEVDNQWSDAEARLLVQTLLPNTAQEFGTLLWNKASKLCHFTKNSYNMRILTSYGQGGESIVKAILTDADTPLHYMEIAERARKRGNNLDIRRVHNAAENIGLLFARGTYGLPKHIPFSDEQMSDICAQVEHIVSIKSFGKQWHTSEILSELIKQYGEIYEELDKYLLDIILTKSKILTSLKRMIWTVALQRNGDTRINRINMNQAIYSIIKEAGHPLSTNEIKKRLSTTRGVNETFCIQPIDPLIRIQPSVWGINDRDIPLSRQEQQMLIEKLADILHKKQNGIHVNELPELLPLKNCSPYTFASIIIQDKRFKVTIKKMIFLLMV